ncbi:Phosphoserine phosphatase RsbU [Streptomyces sp. MBT84]|uniref:PP2C family protein-serine/threonine phosphatase n=1 Tax=unclassified Streptomyces TaxID=2593676 RepID=UPI001C6F0930|nr:PP2C family protein-serine/threonine phosphatase [Streptomyces sp. MBT84]MBW8705969.1 Phosphoserine phosphatase RsbU [Streptomyces sp. MBT84]
MRSQRHKGGGWAWTSYRGLVVIPLALIVAITVADILAPQNIHLGPLLVVAPALTASFGGSRLTAAIGALSIVALVLLSAIRTSVFTSNHESQLIALVVISAFTVIFCRLRERHTAELRQVRSVAEAAQQVVLQPLPERMGTLRIASAYAAATDQARIGGDLYAAVATRRGTRLLIGDVRGKGLPAIEDAALVLGAFRTAAHREPALTDLRSELEATVCWSLSQPVKEGTDAEESFITAVLIDIPDDAPEVHILNCGHPPPLRLRDTQVTVLAPRRYSIPIGMCLPRAPHGAVDTFAFRPGDMLVLYTDGVSEARDGGDGFYPLTDRVAACTDTGTPAGLVDHVRRDILDFCGGTFGDDAALVVVQRKAVTASHAEPPAAGPPVRRPAVSHRNLR